jgi:hypothetical protein
MSSRVISKRDNELIATALLEYGERLLAKATRPGMSPSTCREIVAQAQRLMAIAKELDDGQLLTITTTGKR